MSGLSTHVLDLVAGAPARSVAVRLLEPSGADWATRARGATDHDGRARLSEADLAPGAYRLEFDVGPHFRATGAATADPGFLETVVIAFRVAPGGGHHHVPLLVSPFGYSTYKGS